MVTIGLEAGGRITTTDGLQQGEVVVVSGAYLINSEYIFKHGADPMMGMAMSRANPLGADDIQHSKKPCNCTHSKCINRFTFIPNPRNA